MIFTGDWHLHNFRSYSTITEAGLNSRLSEQISSITGLINWGSQHGASHLIHTGDVFHPQGETLPKDVIRAAYVLFENARDRGIGNIILPGNHDLFREKTIFRLFQDVALIITKPYTQDIGENTFTFIPYTRSPKAFYRAVSDEIKKIDWNSDQPKFLVCHQMFSGVQVGPSQYQLKRKSALRTDAVKLYNYVVAGHCHKPQIVGRNIYYVGSPLQHDHGDEGDEHGFWFWDGVEMKFMPIHGPQFHSIEINNEDDHRHFMQDYIDAKGTPGGISKVTKSRGFQEGNS